ncbi:hypothetical protein BJF93_17410 [Xaviernesmea oryzae]|uniref:DUF1499 domain-containing protein n=1 Tax=Xaviernesmea oryzae TaxID=464029 RepID=A0A1Q9ATA2_9HYPH|nr:DUF1499 domain-containing protein [Xaviernesmea oryzae]OLP58619.1 hypothetical protein BJF93_17410 [Xaviernesmea oryzae]SEK64466.1 Protein of unknown function [Xaviernesmea oryzae]
MKIVYERPVSLAALWARRIGRFSAGLLLVTGLAHWAHAVETPEMIALALLSAGLAALAAILALTGFVRLWQVAAVGGVAAFVGLVYALIPLSVVGYGLFRFMDRPALIEVTTDATEPPPWIAPPAARQGWLPHAPVPDQAARQAEAYPALTGRRYDGALDRVFAGVKTVAAASGLAITAERGTENAESDLEDAPAQPQAGPPADADIGNVPIPSARPEPLAQTLMPGQRASDILLQGEWRSFMAAIPFDVAIRLREEAETTFVDIRVSVRYGPHDLGFAAAFAEHFLRALDAELLGIAGG